MKYTPKYFKENLPEWKRKKDPPTSRIIYRPLSFVTASLAANLGISANAISYFSIILALFACICFVIPNYTVNILGAVFVNIWLLSDCTDGNIARSVKKQPFGDFADSISSYILVGLLCTCMGVCTYFQGGVLVSQYNMWIVVIGALASSSDTLMRLIYQKYKASERMLADNNILSIEEDKRTNNANVNSLRVRIESDLGIGGILPILILIGILIKALDLVLIYCFLYYGASCLVCSLMYVLKAIKRTKQVEENQKEMEKK